jgi:RND family efflux transporter MFP subunit
MNHHEKKEDQHRSGKSAFLITWSITGMITAVIVGVLVYAYNRETDEPQAPVRKIANVEVVTVRTREYNETLTLPARLEADRVAAISAEISGKLARWHVPEGGEVTQGQIVARLDPDEIDTEIKENEASMRTASKNISLEKAEKERADVELAEARKRIRLEEISLEAARSNLELAESEFKRIDQLVGRKAMNLASLDTAKNTLKQATLAETRTRESLASARLGVQSANLKTKEAQAKLEAASARMDELRAALESLKVKRKKTILTAPISGKVEKHLVEPGEVVMAGATLAHIYDLGHIRAIVNVPDRYVTFLDPSNPASQAFIKMNMPGARQQIRAWLVIPGLPKLTGGTGQSFTLDAKIVRIAQASDPTSNTFEVVLRLPNPNGVLRHGIIAQGRIEYLFYPRAIVIPIKAVQVTDEGPRVLIVERKADAQVVRAREIDPVSVRGDKLLTAKGLNSGDRLVVSGWKGLVDGERVHVLIEDGRFVTSSKNTVPQRGLYDRQ